MSDEETPGWTPIGIALFSWRLWRLMSAEARVLWLTLYASPEARRCPTGLWQGGPAAMAEAGEMSVGVVVVALAELERIGAVEYDPDPRVARLMELPDRLTRPSNGNMIRGWWRAWRNVPRCAVAERHVVTLRWLVGPMTKDHEKAWSATFGTLEIAAAAVSDEMGNRSGNGSPNGSPDGSPNRWDPDQDLLSGDQSAPPPLPGDLQPRAREAGPPRVDDPSLAAVVNLAHAAFDRHGPRRSGAGR